MRRSLNAALIPDDVKGNIRRILKRYKNGAYEKQLRKAYFVHFGVRLNVGSFGFPDVSAFIEALDFATVDTSKPSFPVFRSRLPNLPEEQNSVRESFDRSFYLNTYFESFEPGVALRGIPALEFPKVEIGARVDIVLADIQNVDFFYFQLRGVQTTDALTQLMGEMNRFYCSAKSPRFRLPNPKKVALTTQYCAAEYKDEGWHRAFILEVLDEKDKAQILFIDYGTRATVNVRNLRQLHARFGRLPAQALAGRLAGLKPKNGARFFTKIAAKHFRELLRKHDDGELIAVYKGVAIDLVSNIRTRFSVHGLMRGLLYLEDGRLAGSLPQTGRERRHLHQPGVGRQRPRREGPACHPQQQARPEESDLLIHDAPATCQEWRMPESKEYPILRRISVAI
jgi:hypothetical protein